MTTIWKQFTPSVSLLGARLLGLSLLAVYWFIQEGGPIGLLLLLWLSSSTLARWRFGLPAWSVLIDLSACFAAAALWPEALYAAALPAFEAFLAGRLAWIVAAWLIPFILFPPSFSMASLLLVAGWSGWIVRCWSLQIDEVVKQGDRERRDRYELESFKQQLVATYEHTSRYAELAERERIARRLHDHVGHEVTAAVLALQAFEMLSKEQDPHADVMFKQAQQRIVESARQLRETVHDMTPLTANGISRIEDICARFAHCPVELRCYGETGRISPYQWSILETCLKEALTNVMRHASPSRVQVELTVSAHIVRLSVHNDDKGTKAVNARVSGHSPGTTDEGTGIRHLRQLAKYAGGSVTTDRTDGFRLTCVVPLGEENQA